MDRWRRKRERRRTSEVKKRTAGTRGQERQMGWRPQRGEWALVKMEMY